jgi:hypothetical protein
MGDRRGKAREKILSDSFIFMNFQVRQAREGEEEKINRLVLFTISPRDKKISWGGRVFTFWLNN